jgi:hypothetical protein
LRSIASAITPPSATLRIEHERQHAQHAAPDHPVHRADAELLDQQAPRVGGGDLPDRQRAHDEVVVWLPELPPIPATIGMSAARAARRSIEPSKAPTTREATKGGAEVERQPRPAVLRARPHAGEDVLLLAQADLAQCLLLLRSRT